MSGLQQGDPALLEVADGFSVFLQSWSVCAGQTAWGADRGGPDELVGELRGAGLVPCIRRRTFSDPGAPAAVMAAAQDAFGHVDILAANHARSHRQNLEELAAAELDAAFVVNTRATLLLVQAFAAQHDDTRPGGRVFPFASGQYHGAMPDELPYIASKAALHELTPSLAVYLAPRRITLNGINPGPNDSGWADPEVVAQSAARIPGGRWSTPRLIGWLASDEADWATGQTIASDGGWSALNGI